MRPHEQIGGRGLARRIRLSVLVALLACPGSRLAADEAPAADPKADPKAETAAGSSAGPSFLVSWHGDAIAQVDQLGWLRKLSDQLAAALVPLRERHQDKLLVELMHGGRWAAGPDDRNGARVQNCPRRCSRYAKTSPAKCAGYMVTGALTSGPDTGRN